MAGKDLLVEARNVLQSAVTRIDTRVLRHAEELEPKVVSLISMFRETLDRLSSTIGILIEKLREQASEEGVLGLGKYLYIVFSKDHFVVVRSRPFYITLLYDGKTKAIKIKSRNLSAEITASTFTCTYMAIKVDLSIDSAEEYSKKYVELSYVVKKLNHIVGDYLAPLIEARIKLV